MDLLLFHRNKEKEGIKKSLLLSALWISLALLFNVFIYFWKGPASALEFLTGYIIEKSLSVDNIFVMAMILSYFRIPLEDQHRVLFWGILGALVMRMVCIFAGVALINQFHWVIYILGAFLCYTGIKFFFDKGEMSDPEQSFGVRLVKKVFPKASSFMLALLSIEYTDVIFALDSIPAILAITNDVFIIYTSNVFAILGLRALYSVLAHSMKKFTHLKKGIAAILIFIGIKMVLSPFYKIPIHTALGIIVLILLISTLWPNPKGRKS